MATMRDLKMLRLQRLQDRGIVMRGESDTNVWVVADELLVSSDQTDEIERRLGNVAVRRLGHVRLPWRGTATKRGFGAVSGLATTEPDLEPDDDDLPVVDVLQLARDRDPLELAGELRAEGRLVSPNHLVTALQRRLGFPDTDPEPLPVASLPSLPSVLPDRGAGVRVAVIDTGFPVTPAGGGWLDNDVAWAASAEERTIVGVDGHVDLLDETGDEKLDLAAGHGAFVAGLIRRLAPRATIHFIKALDASGVGTEVGVARAIRWAARRRPHVINLSLGFYPTGDEVPTLVENAVRLAQRRPEHPAVVAAVGNDGIADPTWPSSCDDVIGAGALGDSGRPAPFSNTANVDVWAPGTLVPSCYVTGSEDAALTFDQNADTFDGAARWSGTSFAAGIVSGTIAAAVTPGSSGADTARGVVERSGGRITEPDWAFS